MHMKRNLWMIAVMLLSINAHALIVSVNGYGEIDEEGMEITIDEAELDPLTEDMRMDLTGNLLCNGTLTVSIERSSTNLVDEFCCADQCTAGNGQLAELLVFYPSGLASWFIHYTPAPNSDETIRYTFSEGETALTLTLHFVYAGQGVKNVQTPARTHKIMRDGQVIIVRGEQEFSILGTKL